MKIVALAIIAIIAYFIAKDASARGMNAVGCPLPASRRRLIPRGEDGTVQFLEKNRIMCPRMLLVICTLLALPACERNPYIVRKELATKAVLNVLKDPESAKITDVILISPDDRIACMRVNAKNSLGGYTGFKEAVVLEVGGQWTVLAISDISHDDCILKASVESEKFIASLRNAGL